MDALREGKTVGEGPMKTIYFGFDSFDLSSDARATLKANAAWLKANPASTVEIEGHSRRIASTSSSVSVLEVPAELLAPDVVVEAPRTLNETSEPTVALPARSVAVAFTT